jgi:CDGSH-type Zn-finger protein
VETKDNVSVTVLENGPYIVKGTVTLVHKDGSSETKEGSTALCRCGLSKNKPFCDGTHRNSDVLKS